ncbi:inovirus Gp2 family protein [Ralstonia solanacearum]|uniref:inovirus-type Gp2 protein n=1 Tax=Ralstonia pseudosolanacearum TaxID=1310165 RepID=UPI00140281C9|nr:inovirus-type Gp2 protein [Ralstonia pseudosolanacearum]KAF3461270.1 inovirus Gp2 family protein [Ralstonia solanacearum]NKA77519.1 inovirus Gp2 family protein [Ralstonia solanacearum]NKG00121.1 inovirus Gp2 family protein [Ralstonia solanacearum]NKG04840.1 inovirus Gp2 family protein [Ralstonia solanacearum]UNJ30240.1 inovirus Gp2 family protein [Ralstonia pseudosolanacearum]
MNDYQHYDEDDVRQEHHDTITCSEEHDGDMASTITTLSMVVNQMHGPEGKAYHIPINAGNLHGAIDFMTMVLDSETLPYRIGKSGHVRVLRMAWHIKMLRAYARIHDPSLFYSPELEFFFEQYRGHEISRHPDADWVGDDGHDIDSRFAQMAIDFILKIRDEARRRKLKKKISDWKSNGKHNLIYLRTYLNYLFNRYARLMVVDMVFEYRKTACANVEEAIARRDALQGRANREHEAYMNGVVHHEEVPRWVSLVELKEDWDHLKRNMKGKRTIFRHLVGYVGRIEYSRDGGYHLHICFAFNGAEVQDDVGYSLKIARYWSEEITEGRGYAFSCNLKAAKGGYRNIGIGMINHYETEKRRHLWTAVSYFAKATQLVRVKHSGKQQMFLHGKMKKSNGPKRGRPRTKGTELAASE